MDQLVLIAKTARVGQWIKNIVLFAPIVFAGFLFDTEMFGRVGAAFVVFCLLSASVYFFNDLVDLKRDQSHPYKKRRPLASGAMPQATGVLIFLLLSGIALLSARMMSPFFLLAALGYYSLNILYSLYLKSVPVLDVFAIATGFVLRVYAGAFVINVHMDVWFLLTVVSASLLLAVGKRRSELTILSSAQVEARSHRQTLIHYSPELLAAYTTMFANTTWLAYALFSFLHPPFQAEGRVLTLLSRLPRTLVVDKWLMVTVPVVIFGVMRYLQVVYEKNEGESPHRLLMTDRPLLAAVVGWGIMVVGILYFI